MQGQTIITTHDVDELFIFTVVRLIQRRAFPNLRNIIAKTHSADIARWFPLGVRQMATEPKIKGISPDETLEVCARQIIVNYFHEMMSYKEGAKEGVDIEFVHKMRVTSRRLRAAMDNFADCFPKKPFKKHYKKIRAITRTMGAVRDLDVLIARFQNELMNLTVVEQADIRGLIEHLQQKRKKAREPMLTLFEELEETGFETEFLEFFGERYN